MKLLKGKTETKRIRNYFKNAKQLKYFTEHK